MNDFSEDIVLYLEEKLKGEKNYALFFDDIKDKFGIKGILYTYNYILTNINDTGFLNYTIRKINETRSPQNLNALIDFLFKNYSGSEYLNLKVLAIKTISNFKDTSSLPALLSCLNDKNSNYKIRFAAAEALGKIGDKNAFESLTNIVCDEEEKSLYVRESAVVALGLLGDNRALDVFNSIMHTKQMFLDKFSFFKERMIEAMSKMDISKNKKALDILKTSLLDNNKNVRISTIETLMNSDIEENYDLIYERLKNDDDIEVKKNALTALYNLSDASILNEVIEGEYEEELKKYAREITEEYENE